MVVLAAVMMRAIADTVVAYQHQVRTIDNNVMEDVRRARAEPARP